MHYLLDPSEQENLNPTYLVESLLQTVTEMLHEPGTVLPLPVSVSTMTMTVTPPPRRPPHMIESLQVLQLGEPRGRGRCHLNYDEEEGNKDMILCLHLKICILSESWAHFRSHQSRICGYHSAPQTNLEWHLGRPSFHLLPSTNALIKTHADG